MTERLYTLSRNEIIKGFGSFERILTCGKRFENGILTAFVDTYMEADLTGNEKQKIPVKIGVILSKKKLKRRTIETA